MVPIEWDSGAEAVGMPNVCTQIFALAQAIMHMHTYPNDIRAMRDTEHYKGSF